MRDFKFQVPNFKSVCAAILGVFLIVAAAGCATGAYRSPEGEVVKFGSLLKDYDGIEYERRPDGTQILRINRSRSQGEQAVEIFKLGMAAAAGATAGGM